MRKKIDPMMPKIKVTLIERSFKGLRDALFDEFDQLRSNKAKPERANAAARLAGEITKSVAVQCELLRIVEKNGTTEITTNVKGLLQ